MILKCTKSGSRIDKFLIEKLKDTFYSRSKIQKMIKQENVLVNGKKIKQSYILNVGDAIEIIECEVEKSDLIPKDIELDIVYEDDHIAIINKRAGQVVHPGVKHTQDTISNALLHKYKNLPDISGKHRPGIIHRLDKDTSGLLIVALSEAAYYNLIEMQNNREIKKIYWGICFGELNVDEGEIIIPLGRSENDRRLFKADGINSKYAKTKFRVLKRSNGFSLLEFELITGRTHQIRVHMKTIGYPIVGDLQYSQRGRSINIDGKGFEFDQHLLCAKKLEFIHPFNGQKMTIEIDFPVDFPGLV